MITTTSYDTSVRLKEIGLKQESHFYWYDFRQGNPSILACEDSEFVSQGKDDPSAYTSDELLELIDLSKISVVWNMGEWIIYDSDTQDHPFDSLSEGLSILPEALAQAILKAAELKIDILRV